MARDGSGTPLLNSAITWTSNSPDVAAVSAAGMVTGVAPGTAQITVVAMGQQASATVTVSPGAVSSIAVSFGAASARVGDSVAAIALLRDASGTAITGRTPTWSSANATVATVSAAGTVTAVGPGTTNIMATVDAITGSAPFTVGSPSAALVVVNLTASRLQQGKTIPASAMVKDSAGNVIAGSAIMWSTSDANIATVSSTGQVRAVAPGNALVTAVSDGAVGTASLTVIGSPTALVMVMQPSAAAQSGVLLDHQPVVAVHDVSNNPVPLAGVPVTATLSNGHGTLSGNAVVVTDDKGIASFAGLTITGSDLFTFSFSTPDVASASSSVISVGVTTQPPPNSSAQQLGVSTQPSVSAQSGVAFSQQPTVQLRDANGNPVSQSGVTVVVAIATGGGALGGSTSAATDANGLASFTDLSIIGSAGSRTLTFAAAGLSAATSASVTISAGAPTRVSVVSQPSSSAQSGTAFAQQPALRLRDASGNTVMQSGVTIRAGISSGTGGTIGGTLSATTDATGIATFSNLNITGSGNYTLAFTSTGLTGTGSSTINITAAPTNPTSNPTDPTAPTSPSAPTAAKLAITAQPITEASSVVFTKQPTVQLRDASNSAVAQSGVVVTVAIASGGGTLGGTTSATTDATGLATFTNLAITGAVGDRTLTFTAPSLTAVTSSAVTIGAGPAAKLSISNIGSQITGAPFNVTVTLIDGSGNPTSNVGNSGTVTLARQTGTGTLAGTTSGTIPAGMNSVVISGATYSVAESGIVLVATGSGSGSSVRGKTGVSNAFADADPAVTAPTQPSQPSAPVGPTGGAALVEDFSTYTSTSNFLSNPRGIWVGPGNDRPHIVLDQSVGYGSSTQSMRYDYPNNGSVCQDYSINPGFLHFPQGLTHVWVEFVVRFSTNFTVDAGRSDCGKEYKLGALGDYNGGIGRWNLPEMQQGRFVAGYPGNEAGYTADFSTANIWDGQPHVFRAEAQLSSSNSGIFKFWVDGKLLISQSGFNTDPTHNNINIFGPGLNINQGPAIDGMKMWWHRIALFTANPGW